MATETEECRKALEMLRTDFLQIECTIASLQTPKLDLLSKFTVGQKVNPIYEEGDPRQTVIMYIKTNRSGIEVKSELECLGLYLTFAGHNYVQGYFDFDKNLGNPLERLKKITQKDYVVKVKIDG